MSDEQEQKSEKLQPGNYQVVAWDLDTTGRRLVDEICQIGGLCSMGPEQTEVNTFSQYVMPHRNPNPGARRSFGIKVASIGRYRMLRDINTGKILPTKSEVSALQDFIRWLEVCKASSDGVILICHEPQRKVLSPLLLEALYKYNLTQEFRKVVKGFCNSNELVSAVASKCTHYKITSVSLRSLCKTVLGNYTLPTNSATDRCKALIDILARITNVDGEGEGKIVVEQVVLYTNTVASEEQQLKQLKLVLGIQSTLRPIFESQLKQKRLVREKAMDLRRLIAEAGLEYSSLATSLKDGSISQKLVAIGATEDDIRDILDLVRGHFDNSTGDKVSTKRPSAVLKEINQKVENEAVNGDS